MNLIEGRVYPNSSGFTGTELFDRRGKRKVKSDQEKNQGPLLSKKAPSSWRKKKRDIRQWLQIEIKEGALEIVDEKRRKSRSNHCRRKEEVRSRVSIGRGKREREGPEQIKGREKGCSELNDGKKGEAPYQVPATI